jgi:dienelactone hydrolase
MHRLAAVASALALAVLLFALARLGVHQAAGPTHADLLLSGGIPATLYLPGRAHGPYDQLPPPPPQDQRPPVVVLAHGFAADRAMMSTLARRLAQAGYAVLTFDFRGHGENRNPFPAGAARPDALGGDFAAAVDFVRTSPQVNGSRVVVMGHSMGADAALDFATRDSGLDGVVAISGGWTLQGPYSPPNVLFLWASGDPPDTREPARALAAQLAGVDAVQLGRSYGLLPDLRGVRAVEVPGNDHLTILWSKPAAAEIVAWLDAIFQVQRLGTPPQADPRLLDVALALGAFLVVLVGIGLAVAALAPRGGERSARAGLAGLSLLAAALLLASPAVAAAPPLGFLGLEVGDVLISQLALAGAGLLGLLALAGRLDTSAWRPGFGRGVAAGLAGFAAVYALLAPLGVVGHRLVPTPERLLASIVTGLLVFPFFFGFELALRRGNGLAASGLGVAGRLLVLGLMLLGVAIGVIPFVVVLMLPVLAALFLFFEIVAAALHAAGRNLVALAVLETAWFAWMVGATLPLRW